VVILPDADDRNCTQLVERLTKRLHGQNILPTPVPSFSIGKATYHQDGITYEELFRAADRAMYANKRGSKLKVP
jgi:GGDEF domain-containing protein